jgi:glycerol-3-phosphate acyltransferase PlsX
MEKVVGIKNPRVGLVNVGVEEEKGNALVKETYPLLKACKDINFIGSVEAREIPYGACDVIVCDAFVGNVILKLYEGTAGALVKMIKKGIMESTRGKLGGILIKPSLKKTMKLFDTSEYGGAPFLGLNGLVVKIHGNSKDGEVRSAVKQCIAFKEQKIDELIRQNVVPEKQNI